MRRRPPTPETKDGPGASAKKRTRTVHPTTSYEQKGNTMFSPHHNPWRLRHQGPGDIGATALLTVALFALPAAAHALAALLGGASA